MDAIVALGPPGALAAQKATASVPIVFVVSTDPVGAGLVRSLAQPGGNITGISNLGGDVSPEHLEMLPAMVPRLADVAVLVNPGNPAHGAILENVKAAAQTRRTRIVPAKAQTAGEIERAFAGMARERAGAVIVALDPLFIQQRSQIAGLQRSIGCHPHSRFGNRSRPAVC